MGDWENAWDCIRVTDFLPLVLKKDKYTWNINYVLWTVFREIFRVSWSHQSIHCRLYGEWPKLNVWDMHGRQGTFPALALWRPGLLKPWSGCNTKGTHSLPCPCLCLLLITICTMVPEACWESVRAPRWLLAPGKRSRPPACRLGGGS